MHRLPVSPIFSSPTVMPGICKCDASHRQLDFSCQHVTAKNSFICQRGNAASHSAYVSPFKKLSRDWITLCRRACRYFISGCLASGLRGRFVSNNAPKAVTLSRIAWSYQTGRATFRVSTASYFQKAQRKPASPSHRKLTGPSPQQQPAVHMFFTHECNGVPTAAESVVNCFRDECPRQIVFFICLRHAIFCAVRQFSSSTEMSLSPFQHEIIERP